MTDTTNGEFDDFTNEVLGKDSGDALPARLVIEIGDREFVYDMLELDDDVHAYLAAIVGLGNRNRGIVDSYAEAVLTDDSYQRIKNEIPLIMRTARAHKKANPDAPSVADVWEFIKTTIIDSVINLGGEGDSPKASGSDDGQPPTGD